MGHQTVLLPAPINFFTGVGCSSQHQKVGWMQRWVVEKVLPGPKFYQHAISMQLRWSCNLLSLLVQWWCFTAMELLPLRNGFCTSESCHHTRDGKSTVLPSGSGKKRQSKKPQSKPPTPSLLSNWKANLNSQPAHLLAFHLKERVFRCKGVEQHESSLKYSV